MVVCMKVVPKPEEIRVDPETRMLDRADARAEINIPDMRALETALRLQDQYGGQVSVLSMGPLFFEPYLRVTLAMGVDHIYLLSDRAFAGADTLATTYTLSQGIQKLGEVDLVFCGEESSDGATGQVPPGLAEWLDVAQLTLVTDVTLVPSSRRVRGCRVIKGGYEILEVPMPCVISVKTASNEPRFMDFRIKPLALEEERVTVWNAATLGADPECLGLAGSPTIVTELSEAISRQRKRNFLEGSPEEVSGFISTLLQEVLW
jgi:electron transfer flavoprotein beta subunit